MTLKPNDKIMVYETPHTTMFPEGEAILIEKHPDRYPEPNEDRELWYVLFTNRNPKASHVYGDDYDEPILRYVREKDKINELNLTTLKIKPTILKIPMLSISMMRTI